jgi:hypothetical protein
MVARSNNSEITHGPLFTVYLFSEFSKKIRNNDIKYYSLKNYFVHTIFRMNSKLSGKKTLKYKVLSFLLL